VGHERHQDGRQMRCDEREGAVGDIGFQAKPHELRGMAVLHMWEGLVGHGLQSSQHLRAIIHNLYNRIHQMIS